MSMIAIPFAVDIEKVKAVFGSKDAQLYEAIKTADLYEHYARQDDTLPDLQYERNFSKALEDILFRYVKPGDRKVKRSLFGFIKPEPLHTGLDKTIGSVYGYALLVICDYLGTHLLPACDGFYYGRDFKAAAEIMKQNGLKLNLPDMFEQHNVFDIPESNDFPAIKHFTKPEIEHISAVMDKINIDESKTDFDNDDFEDVQDMLKNIKDSFLFCRQNNLDMLTFTH